MTENSIVWQYCAIRMNIDGSAKKLKYFDAEGNHKGSDIEDPHKEIAKLGLEGWELVSLTQIQKPDARVYYFKRKA